MTISSQITQPFVTQKEVAQFIIGLLVLIVVAPFYIVLTIMISIWEKADRLFKGEPRTGFIFTLATKINDLTKQTLEKYVVYKEDAYIINVIIALGTIIPGLILINAWYTVQYGLSLTLVLIYHAIRLGPQLVNFSIIQSLSHKEGHAGTEQFQNCPQIVKDCLGNAFCWLLGPLYGILPYSFKIGHTINHHKYNNGKRDTICNSDMERDSSFNFVRYLQRFLCYSTNISLFPEFIKDRQYKSCFKLLIGNLYYILLFIVFAKKVSLMFSLLYIGYPFLENVFYIAAYNWTWHAFIDPEDPTNEYANSITIINGSYNMVDRDLHVVHHAFPGVHWSKYRKIYENDKDTYTKKSASLFEKTYAKDIFFMMIFKQYDKLAEKFIYSTPLSQEEKIKFIQRRLRSITWGRKQNVFVQDENQKKSS